MAISRRHLFRQLGAAAVAAAAAPSSFGEAASPSSAAAPALTRLDRNENAYGASERVVAAMVDASRGAANRYADAEAELLRIKIARFHSVSPEHVVLGCGSADILRMAADAFTGSTRPLVVASPTVELISEYARRAGADVVALPLRADYAYDLPAMLARCDGTTGLVYICNPHNPTGTLTRRRDLDAFLRELPDTVHVVIDEAYHHYVTESPDYASFVDRPVDNPRVVVTRSFSKIHGLAGVRVGYAIATPAMARLMTARRAAAELSIVAAQGAMAALDDAEHVRISVGRTVDDRQEFVNQAHARMLKAIDSQTNFVMLNAERPAVDVIDHFKSYGVVLPPPIALFDTHIRVSLGTPAEMREFWEVWDVMPRRHRSM
jgi:histidinol-phosphate aminotransferase